VSRPKDRLRRVMIIGATPSGIVAANKLGELGIPVTLVDDTPDLNQKLADESWRFQSGIPFNYAHRPGIIRILRNPRIQCILPARVNMIRHNSQGFSVSLTTQPTFVNADKCTLCGRCMAVCPNSSDTSRKPIQFNGRNSLPGRPVIDKRQTPLCQAGCPLGVNVQGYVALAKAGRYQEALNLIREKNVLPGICGRICAHPCETNCRRGQLDDAVSIRAIKRFLADAETRRTEPAAIPRPIAGRNEKFAVIGSGPAGLAAAARLAQSGCQVHVFEKEAMAGGLLRYGIGPHRLPREVLNAELAYIHRLGVTFHLSHPILFPDDVKRILAEFDGVLVATGTWADRKLGVPGEDLMGVSGCLSFLSRLYQGGITEYQHNVAVIGDGNAAFDLARTLVRIGATVTLISWFGLSEIPADAEEVEAARIEGIHIIDRFRVVAFEGLDGRLSQLVCMPTRPGPPDASGIAWPVSIPDAQPVHLEFDAACVAIGQAAPQNPGLTVTEKGHIRVDDRHRTDIPQVYAAGDSASGPSSVVWAMAGGQAAADVMLNDICGIQAMAAESARPDPCDFPEISDRIPIQRRTAMPEISIQSRKHGFEEVALGLSETQIQSEAGRCLQCGVCAECLLCVEACQAIGAIHHQETPQTRVEPAGVVVIADAAQAPQTRGDDIIRAYGPSSSKTDIHAMILRGFAAAAQAVIRLESPSLIQKGRGISFYQPDSVIDDPKRIGVFVCQCNQSLGWLPEMDDTIRSLGQLPHVVHSGAIGSACVPDGVAAIIKTIRDKGITRIVLGSCVCCPLDFVCSACTDQRSRLKHQLFTATGISRSMAATCNIRGEALSLLPKDSEQARHKFNGLLIRSIRNAGRLKPFPSPARNYSFIAAIIGDSPAALHSAHTLAESGMDIFVFGNRTSAGDAIKSHANIHWFEDADIHQISGTLGDFTLDTRTGDLSQKIHVGAVILGEKSRKRIGYVHQAGLPTRPIACAMQQQGVTGIPFFYPGMTSISGLFVADPPGISVSARQKGEAAAILVAAAMPRGPRKSKGYTVSIDSEVCRGCGRCVDACPYHAVSLYSKGNDAWAARVDEAFCKGCGNCISVCPSNAADSPYRSQLFFEQTLEDILCQTI